MMMVKVMINLMTLVVVMTDDYHYSQTLARMMVGAMRRMYQ